MDFKKLIVLILLLSSKVYSQHSIDQKFDLSAVFDLTREYNFVRAIENVYEFEVEKIKQFDGQHTYQVKGQSRLCSFNSPYLSQKEFDQLFIQSAKNSQRANLQPKVALDVIHAYSFARHFGAECLSGHYEEDIHSDIPGDQKFVCDHLSKPKNTIVYLSISFKVHPEINSKLNQGFFSCFKNVPYGQPVDINLFELEADFPKMGLKLLN